MSFLINSYIFEGLDPNAQAFITAAGITNPTQQQAINTLVIDLKGYGIWTKMKAIYPFVGGTASTHKWNLKDPRDLDAAFRLVFAGGVTHSSNGFLPNGTNGVANTHLSPSLLTNNNTHISVYSRTDSNGIFCDIGVSAPASTYIPLIGIYPRDTNNFASRMYNYNAGSTLLTANTDSRGLFISNRTSSTVLNQWKNGIKQGTATYTNTNNVTTITQNIHLGAINLNGTLSQYSNREQAFASIGDGLTDTEAANFYTAVQAYQTTLGRSIGTQVVSDADAQAFVTAANIQDQVQADAVNNLTIGLKADGLWSKMKAIYPFVGGDATSHKFNLKNPLDTDAAFRLVFNGGWTHSNTGALPNGTNAYADTKLNPTSSLTINNAHISIYSRTNIDILAVSIGSEFNGSQRFVSWLRTGNATLFPNNSNLPTNISNTDSRGLFINNRVSSTGTRNMIRGVQQNQTITSAATYANANIFLARPSTIGAYYDSKEYAFSTIGDGLSDQNLTDLYTLVQNYQVALSRNV